MQLWLLILIGYFSMAIVVFLIAFLILYGKGDITDPGYEAGASTVMGSCWPLTLIYFLCFGIGWFSKNITWPGIKFLLACILCIFYKPRRIKHHYGVLSGQGKIVKGKDGIKYYKEK